MMRRYLTRRRVAATLAALALGTAGCTDNEESEPNAPPEYQQPPEDLCARVQFDEVLQRWELSTPSWPEPDSDTAYSTGRAWWDVRCKFAGVAEDGQFTTELGDFGPRGGVELTIYHKVADAASGYDGHFRGLLEQPEGNEPEDVTGWWDTGVSVTLTEELNPEDFADHDEFEITSLDTRLLVRHENLVTLVYMNTAYIPADEVDEAAALMEELAAAMLDESVEHLPRDTG